MSTECFGIFLFKDNNEKFITNLSVFNYFIRSNIKKFMYASAKEIIDRTKTDSIIDLEIEYDKPFFLVGIKNKQNCCLIFTTEDQPHNHLISLSQYILLHGLSDNINENFDHIKTELKCKKILKGLEDAKFELINDIELIMERGEKLDDLIIKTEYLDKEGKRFYDKTKKMNKCCYLF